MTTFQAIVYAIVHGFSEFLPISSGAHHILVPYLLNWNPPEGALLGAMTFGTFLSLTIYYIHDWASIASCFVQVIVFRKRPMTLDERMPFFLFIGSLPAAAAVYYLDERGIRLEWPPIWIAASLALFGLPLWMSESFSRKTKGMFDWNWLDCLLVGITESALLFPGCGRITGALTGTMLRNYNRDAAVKFALFLSGPALGVTSFIYLRKIEWGGHFPAPELSWLSLGSAFLVSFLTGLLAIGGLTKHVQRKGFGQYAAYRMIVAIGVGIVFWMRSRG